jgi:glycosyltransferase involved in cell wall biosynthesis
LRLGIYIEGVYSVVETEAGPRLAAISEFHAFLLFVAEVGKRFDKLVFFGRAARGGEDATHVVPVPAELVELPYYASVRDVDALTRGLPRTTAAIWRALPRVDAVWAFGPHPLALLVVFLAAVRGKRVVLGVRKDAMHYYRSRLPSRRWAPVLAGLWVMDVLYRRLARRFPATVVGSEIARRYGGPPARVLPMTVSLVREREVAAAPPERDWTGTVELLTVGRIEQEKNPLLLVEALAALERRRPGRYRLAWAGVGPLAETVRARADELGIADRIAFVGFLPHGPKLLELYRRAHAFVHVSMTEGVPQTLVEALASGTPLVATDVGGVRAALDDGRAGLLVPPADVEAVVAAVERITDDEVLRRRLVSRGLELVRKVTLETEAGRVAQFIAEAS